MINEVLDSEINEDFEYLIYFNIEAFNMKGFD
jgi:hypothetical protein